MLNMTQNKPMLFIVALSCALAACVKQSDPASKKTEEKQQQVQVAEDKVSVIPAMLARSFKVKLAQPTVCENEAEFDNEMICTHYEVIGLKSNIAWIDTIISKQIKTDYAESLTKPTATQIEKNKTRVEGTRNWSRSSSFHFAGQFGRYVQIVENTSEYSGGAHGMAYINNYVYDLETKKRVTLDDIVVTGKKAALKEALWQSYLYYCQDNDMEPMVEKKDFDISPNFLINQDGGLTFDYQLYELGPYVMGFTRLTLSQIQGLIREDFLSPMPEFEQEY